MNRNSSRRRYDREFKNKEGEPPAIRRGLRPLPPVSAILTFSARSRAEEMARRREK